MTIPATDPEAAAGSAAHPGETSGWSRLEPAAKRERLLQAATAVFARDGLEAPMSVVADHPDVIAAATRASEAQERLLVEARAEGHLRADATTLDLRLLFAATRAARRVEPDQWPRMLELMIDALEARPAESGH